ncbi:tripartite motif-containing protein 45-like [Asterias rubens]|uniref:tripartite motif-containing protein 45-like n=1 Tax=Asterias rubens TaxID=7604 RepID=UPI001455A464|nr:tripartite motif-containing protein 45-like [Asterias rubens]
MANFSSSSYDAAKLECPKCDQQFKDPKILHCLHSFCKNCLCKSDGATKVIVCPLCSRETKVDLVDKLKSSSHLVEKLKGFRIQEEVTKSPKTELICRACLATGNVASRCLDCSMYLCMNCKIVHGNIPALSQHKVVSLDDLSGGKGLKTPRKEWVRLCTEHPGEKLKFCCQTCKQWACRDCRIAKHDSQNHTVVDNDLYNSKCRSWIKECTASLEKAVTRLQSMSEAFALQAVPEFKTHAEILIKTVNESASEYQTYIDSQKMRLIQKIDRVYQEQRVTLNRCAVKVDTAMWEMRHAIDTANEVANVSSDEDFGHLQAIVKDELSTLLKRKPSDFYHGLPLMKVVKVRKRRVPWLFGQVELGGRVALLPPPTKKQGTGLGHGLGTFGSTVTSLHPESGAEQATVVDNSITSVPAFFKEKDQEVPGVKREQIANSKASTQVVEARKVKRRKTRR